MKQKNMALIVILGVVGYMAYKKLSATKTVQTTVDVLPLSSASGAYSMQPSNMIAGIGSCNPYEQGAMN